MDVFITLGEVLRSRLVAENSLLQFLQAKARAGGMMPTNDDDNRRTWLNDFRELAKRFEEEELQFSDDPYELIRIYVDATDIAIAVWDDASRPDGFGWLWVKGYDLVSGGLPPGQYRTLGIPCADENEAGEILDMFPEYDRQN